MNTRRPRGSRLVVAILILGLGLTSLRTASAQEETDIIIHIVAWGETLMTIASSYGVTVEGIVAANHLADADRIFAGQQLIVPRAAENAPSQTVPASHIVQPGETLYRISLRYGLSVQTLAVANGLTDADYVYAGQVLVIPPPDGDTAGGLNSMLAPIAGNVHIVQPGETLFHISQQYGVSIASLEAANVLLNPSRIFAGQTLIIPGAAATSSPGYTPAQATVTHTVQPGETLSAIGARYGVSLWVIAQTNNISNPSLIYGGQVLTIPSAEAISPAGKPGPSGKSIVVDLSEQRAYIYENGALLQTFVVSTGIQGRETWRGSFAIQNKLPVAYAATWDLQMPYWLGFYWAGPLQNGFHALPILPNGLRLWEGLLGSPASYGCVILSEDDARWLYEWAEIGTPVVVHD